MKKKLLLAAGLIFICIILSGCNKEDLPHTETDIYEILEGQLTAYHGEDTELYLPETVIKLSKASFQNSLSDIERIHIGRNVDSISWDTFVNMPFLSSVYVDAENASYVSDQYGKYVASRDGSMVFAIGTNMFDTDTFAFADSIGVERFCAGGFQVIVDGMVLYFSEPTEFVTSTDNCMLERMEAYGQTLELNTNFLGNHAVSIENSGDFVLITDLTYGVGDTYIMFESGIWEQHNMENPSNENYNDPIVRYYLGKDSILHFECRPRKYCFTGIAGDELRYSTGLDELYCVEGTASFTNGKPVLTVVKETLFGERFTEQELLLSFQHISSPEIRSIEQLFEYNNKHFQSFEYYGES